MDSSPFQFDCADPANLLSDGMLRSIPWVVLSAVTLGLFHPARSPAAEKLPALIPSLALQALLKSAVEKTVHQFKSAALRSDQLAVTLIDLRQPARLLHASLRGKILIYPASVIKLFYLAAAHRWIEDARLADTPELQRALRDMIVDSSNDATHYVIDLLTGTTSGPEIPEAEIQDWWDKRNAVTRYFTSLGYTGINASKKPWSDGPYGRESQAIRRFEPKRNWLSTDATARLFAEIALERCVSPARSRAMLTLLARDPRTTDPDPDHQAKFTGPILPTGAHLWSKAGWTSQPRHDATCVELPNGSRFVLVIFTTDHANEREIIRSLAATIINGLSS